jgi:tetratricopeptide (TPR) repeat protein
MHRILLWVNWASGWIFRNRISQCVVFSLLMLSGAWAKDAPITGVLLLRNSGGPGYIQISGLLINGKTELRACNAGHNIDKSEYKNMAKLNLATLRILERLSDGTLTAQMGAGSSTCVVPSNYKFEKDGSMSLSELVDKSSFTAQVLGSLPAGQNALAGFPIGAKLLFGTAADAELAEYYLADREQTTAIWQAYLDRNPKGAHLNEGKVGLVKLLVREGSERLLSYQKSAGSAAPQYDDLKLARERADQAITLIATDPTANQLRADVRVQLKEICDRASAKLQGFRDATVAHAHGYELLITAKDLSDHVAAIDTAFAPGITLRNSVAAENRSLDEAIQKAVTLSGTQQYDKAYETIWKYLSFADEEPRLGQIVANVYKFHFDKGTGDLAAGNLQEAVDHLQRATEIKPTPEAKSALIQAQGQLLASKNKAAADKALELSQGYVANKDNISAYEVLANLNEAQRLLVKDKMAELQDAYVQSATAHAIELQKAHNPIQGKEDEIAWRQAWDLLDHASKLSDNFDISAKRDLVAQGISNHYIDLGKKYLDKPLSSGVGIGWSYLEESREYVPKSEDVSNLMTTNRSAYEMRSKLSIGVVFLDQTSRRDSSGFTDQMQQAFSTGLSRSGLTVVDGPPSTSDALRPNFVFKGEILQHRTIRNSKKDTLQSEYRSSAREIPNEEWNKADQEFEAQNLKLQESDGALEAARRKNNKKEIELAERNRTAVVATRQAALVKMNSIPKTKVEGVISSYNYTQTTLELTSIVEMQFRITDAAGHVVGDPMKILKGEQPKKFIILDNIKADDTKGLKERDTPPDELQLLTDVEIEARDSIVEAARAQAKDLPQKILAHARDLVASNDVDGAGESYVLYLNSTPVSDSQERAEASRFLATNFNLRHAVKLGVPSK